MRYVVKSKSNEYLTNRKPTGKRMYESRVSWSSNLDDAKVFNTKGAATNSARQSGNSDFEVLPCSIILT